MKYRREIDGLRAIAVIPVILFHAGFDLFQGGFVGVDVFFVISGYLITSIILSDLEHRRFSLKKFYERRVRRIIPALLLVTAICIPLSWIWLLPMEMRFFSQSVAGVALFSSNFIFYRQSGYFDTEAELKPLLHTWSLAVEEQFYVLFPLFLLVAWSLGRKLVAAVIAGVAFVSFLLADWGSFSYPSASFFMLPTRAWELSLGALVALYLFRADQPIWTTRFSDIFSVAGLILIFWGVFMFDATTPYPGRYAAVPVLGTVLIIIFCGPQGLVGKILGVKIMVAVGLISYSAYLWHQPIFAFSRQLNFGHLSVAHALTGVVGTLLLAALTWRFVEQPFRKPDTVANVHIWVIGALGSIGLATFGVAGHLTNGFPERALLPETIISTFQRSHSADRCFDIEPSAVGEDWLCDLGQGHGDVKFLVFGDSHALSLFDLFDAIGDESAVSGQFVGASGCPPLAGQFALKSAARNKSCFELNQRVFEHVATNDIDVIILVARWRNYTDKAIGVSSANHELSDFPLTAFRESVRATLEKWKAIGVDVYVVEQPPEQNWLPQLIYLRAKESGGIDGDVIQRRSVSLADHLAVQASANPAFLDLLEKGRWIPTTSAFCEREVCPVGDTEGSFYLDQNHLSDYGARRLDSEIRRVMDW